jgi:hypothetical protein
VFWLSRYTPGGKIGPACGCWCVVVVGRSVDRAAGPNAGYSTAAIFKAKASNWASGWPCGRCGAWSEGAVRQVKLEAPEGLGHSQSL